jgi:DNA-binding beta-propeller fold protein YncE
MLPAILRRLGGALLLLLLAHPAGAALQRVDLVGTLPAGTPLSLAVDQDGRIYSSQEDGSVLVLDPSGAALMRLGGKATDPAGKPILEQPRGIALSRDRIYVADAGLDRVAVFTRDGDFVEAIGSSGGSFKHFDSPRGVFVIGDVVYVADTDNDRVQILGPNGVFMGAFPVDRSGKALEEPQDVVVDARCGVYAIDGDSQSVQVFSPAGEPVLRFGKHDEAVALAVDRDGVLVADAGNNKIIKYGFDGKELFSFGTRGKERTQFLKITGVAVDRAGKIYVADLKKGQISVFLPEAGARGTPADLMLPPSVAWQSMLPGLTASKVAAGRDGVLYAVDRESGAIAVVREGRVTRTITVPEARPIAVAEDAEGGLWVLDEDKERVVHLDAEGKTIASFGAGGSTYTRLDDPTDIVVSRRGVIFVSNTGNKRILGFSTDGLLLKAIGGAEDTIRKPIALAVDEQDRLYAVDRDDKAVHVYSPEGVALATFGGEPRLKEPVSIAVTGTEVFVLDKEDYAVRVFSKDGRYVRSFGAPGAAPGDLASPLSLAAPDEVHIVVADTGNARLATYRLIYTPRPPVKLTPVAGMHAVTVTWEPSPDPFADHYLVYRREGEAFKEIASVAGFRHVDPERTPGTRYEYALRAVAAEGNASPLSEVVGISPEKYRPGAPKGVAARADEWSVELSWTPAAEGFVREYTVYRDQEGRAVRIGTTVEPRFREEGLSQDAEYTYSVSATSTDDIEGAPAVIRTKTMAPTKAPIEIEVVSLSNIFSNTYKIYESDGIGALRVVNNSRDRISRLTVSFMLQNFMDFPSEVTVADVAPGQQVDIPLKVVLNNHVLSVTEDTAVQAEIRASYYRNLSPVSITKRHTLNVYEKHRLMWDVRERYAVFITPKDPGIMEFIRAVVTQYPEVENPLARAGVVFEALGTAGLTYLPDPSNPYQIVSEKTDTVDYVQYPQETLQRSSGDCDDLVGLYASALESLGLRTMVLDVPGHMFMMFSSNIEDTPEVDTMEGMFVRYQGMLWVPVETTLVGSPFLKAWEEGSKTYQLWQGKSLDMLDIRRAWERYKPASLPSVDLRSKAPARAAIETRFDGEVVILRKLWIRYQGSTWVKTLRRDPNDVQALQQLGILFARSGILDEALTLLEKARAHVPESAAVQNNLGNIYFLLRRYDDAIQAYEQSAAADPGDPLVKVNLAKACLEGGDKEKATAAFNEAMALEPLVKTRYKALYIKLVGLY